jgi:hypothetical protein
MDHRSIKILELVSDFFFGIAEKVAEVFTHACERVGRFQAELMGKCELFLYELLLTVCRCQSFTLPFQT